MVKEITEEGRNERVVFLLFVEDGGSLDSLLSLQIKNRLNDLKDTKGKPIVEVKTIRLELEETCGLEEIGKGFDHVMVDEFYWDFMCLSEEKRKKFLEFAGTKKTVWIALSNAYNAM